MARTKAVWIHRIAGISASFSWQDEGMSVEVDYTVVLGSIPREEGQEPYWIVKVGGTADSGFGYSYPVARHLAITRNGEREVVDDATDEQMRKVQS